MAVTVHNFTRSVGAGGKFVVLVDTRDSESGAILFSDFTVDSQHMDIVRRYERGLGTTARLNGLAVRGGGWWKKEEGRLVLYGSSAAYGHFDEQWVRSHLTAGTVFGEEAIVFS